MAPIRIVIRRVMLGTTRNTYEIYPNCSLDDMPLPLVDIDESSFLNILASGLINQTDLSTDVLFIDKIVMDVNLIDDSDIIKASKHDPVLEGVVEIIIKNAKKRILNGASSYVWTVNY